VPKARSVPDPVSLRIGILLSEGTGAVICNRFRAKTPPAAAQNVPKRDSTLT